MKCKYCGADIPDDSKVCPICNKSLEETVTEENVQTEAQPEAQPEVQPEVKPEAEEKKTEEQPATEHVEGEVVGRKASDGISVSSLFDKLKSNTKVAFIAAAVLVVLIIAGIASCGKGGKSAYKMLSSNYYAHKGIYDIFSDEEISGIRQSYNGSSILFVKEDELYVLNSKGSKDKIASDYSSQVISANGAVVLYFKDVSSGYGDLYAYNVKKKKSTKIDKEVYTGSVVMSQNGTYVAYTKGERGDRNLYVSKNGKAGKKKYSKATPIAVSDNGKYVYYLKDGKFYCGDNKIASDGLNGGFYFNQDLTEVLYMRDGSIYKSRKGKEGEKVKSDATLERVLLPANSYDYSYYTRDDNGNAKWAEITGVKSFKKAFLKVDGALYYLNSGELEKIASDYATVSISPNGKSVLFYYNSKVKYVKNIDKSTDPEELVDEKVTGYYASNDLKTVYVRTQDKEIAYVKGNKLVTLFDSADADVVVFNNKAGVLVVQMDEEVYTFKKSAKSKKKVKVKGEVLNLGNEPDGSTIIITDDDGTNYVYKLKGASGVSKLGMVESEDED